jgi:hypothetical protein
MDHAHVNSACCCTSSRARSSILICPMQSSVPCFVRFTNKGHNSSMITKLSSLITLADRRNQKDHHCRCWQRWCLQGSWCMGRVSNQGSRCQLGTQHRWDHPFQEHRHRPQRWSSQEGMCSPGYRPGSQLLSLLLTRNRWNREHNRRHLLPATSGWTTTKC